jgi:hypothetical protein
MPTVKNVGEPCAGEPHARFDGGREETSDSRPRRATPGASRLPDQPRWRYARMEKVAPSERFRHELDEVLAGVGGEEDPI